MNSNVRNYLKKNGFNQGGGLNNASVFPLPEDFWEVFRGMVALDTTGRLYFTERGQAVYTPILRKAELSLDAIRTIPDFLDALHRVVKIEAREEVDRLHEILGCPDATESQKRIARRFLAVREPQSSASIVSLADVRLRRTSS